jgi:hypothetical protein
MKKYFLHDGNKQTGGFTLAEISKMKLSPATHVWFDGLPDWKSVESFGELRPFINYSEKANGITDSEKIKTESGKDKADNTKRDPNKIGANIFMVLSFLGLFGLYVLWEKSYPYIKDFIYPTITFHTEDLQIMAKSGDEYINTRCSNEKFSVTPKNVYNDGAIEKTIFLFRKKGEAIQTVSSEPFRFQYAFAYKGAYTKLLNEIKGKETEILPVNERDVQYKNCEQYVLGDCVFVDCGYQEKVNYSVIAVIRKDKLIPAATTVVSDSSKAVHPNMSSQTPTKMLGLWSGESDSKNISFVIEKIDGAKVKGYSSVDGNFTAFDGEITANGSGYRLKLEEQQDNNSNGTFDLAYDSLKQIISGRWKSYDESLSLELNLTPVPKGKTATVITDTAYIYDSPDYSAKTSEFLVTGSTMQFDSLNRWFIHCTYQSNEESKSGWVIIKKVAFQ